MRVMQVVRFDAGLFYGGGEVQAEKTREALLRHGSTVEVFRPDSADLGDVLHFFGNFDYYDEVAAFARQQGVPYVVSPIFATSRSAPRLRWRRLRQSILGGYRRSARRLLEGAAAVVAMSDREEECLKAYFGNDIPLDRVPNGVEERFARGDARRFLAHHAVVPPFAVMVGGLMKGKNQLAAIRACRDDVPLLVVGPDSDPAYAAVCRSEAGRQVQFLGPLPHEGDALSDLLAAAHTFVHPSLHETFGMAAMEATVAGCHLLLSNRWNAEAIWSGDATYFDPDRPEPLRQLILESLRRPRPGPDRAVGYLQRYSWDAVAAQLQAIYGRVLAKGA